MNFISFISGECLSIFIVVVYEKILQTFVGIYGKMEKVNTVCYNDVRNEKNRKVR